MDWFTLTIILSFVASTLVLSMRAITAETNPFLFMSMVTGIAAIILAIICQVKGFSLLIADKAILTAIAAGISVTLLDIAFIFMFRKGATVSVSMQVFRVSSIVISAIVGFILFREGINLTKFAGILCACAAVYLLNSKPKGEVK